MRSHGLINAKKWPIYGSDWAWGGLKLVRENFFYTTQSGSDVYLHLIWTKTEKIDPEEIEFAKQYLKKIQLN
jgi:hypothetical protein